MDYADNDYALRWRRCDTIVPEVGSFRTSHTTSLQTRNSFVCSSFAAFLSAGVTSAFYNPLDCLRVRWQALPTHHPAMSSGFVDYGASVMKQEGLLRGLWKPGLPYNMTGMALSASIRFGSYEIVRDYLLQISSHSGSKDEKKKTVPLMLVSGLLVGSFGYMLTTPFHLVKTMTQAQRAQYIDSLSHVNKPSLIGIIRSSGIPGLWRGAIPLACRGALFTSGQMLGYDGLKTVSKEYNVMDDGLMLHVLSSIGASFCASVMSAPADLVMTKFMADPRNSSTSDLMRTMEKIVSEQGIIGFWKGWGLSFLRLTPVMLTYSTFYEQVRHVLGIGYFT